MTETSTMKPDRDDRARSAAKERTPRARLAALGTLLLVSAAATAPAQDGNRTLDETRLTMGKWIETQQILSKERLEWQQGKEILLARLELLRKDVAGFEEKIREAQSSVASVEQKRAELTAQNDQLVAVNAHLAEVVGGMEGEVRKLVKSVPEPVQAKVQPLLERMPTEATTTKVSPAERFQNVLVILGILNGANNEIAVNYEVRTLSDGKPSEVKAIYVGLAQAYYVSARGQAGIGRPGAEGWQWETSDGNANDVLKTLEIIQGTQTPAFVPLPMRIQ
jgi:uncharacterized protein DUF3450